jgi:hypothetical protein
VEFKTLKADLKGLNFEKLRADEEDYFEAVIVKPLVSSLTEKLDKNFGPAIWPSAGEIPEEAQKAIEDFGGVMPGQTLYFVKQGNTAVFAMLWPWQDGVHITLKSGVKA